MIQTVRNHPVYKQNYGIYNEQQLAVMLRTDQVILISVRSCSYSFVGMGSAQGRSFWYEAGRKGDTEMISNEILLVLSLVVIYSMVLLMFALFREHGLYTWTVIATITANIEVMILVHAFGMDMTLGNVLFASTFLVTDILSEVYGKQEARRAVWLGIATSCIFIVISQSWLLYHPAAADGVFPHFKALFVNTPRLMAVSVAVYVVSQMFDVWLYHAWWDFSTRRAGDRRKFLWLRNNGSTLVSQIINTVLYNLGAFAGVYSAKTLLSIIISGYVIFIVTSLADTPFVYLARTIAERRGIHHEMKDRPFYRRLER